MSTTTNDEFASNNRNAEATVAAASYMPKPAAVRPSTPAVAVQSSEPSAREVPIGQNIGLYTSPRLEMVERFLAQYGEYRPISVEDMLPVTLMNYGRVEIEEAQAWFEAGEEAPIQNDCPTLIDVGAGFGPAGLVFGARQYKVTAVEMQADIAAIGQRVATACGLQNNVVYEVTDVMAFEPATPADVLISVLCLLHVPDKEGVMRKLASLLRAGGRAYIADFYAKGELSETEQTLLKDEVGCPGLLTKEEYIGALKEAGFHTVRFEDVTPEYSTFVNNRFTTYLRNDKSERHEELTRFFRTADILFCSGDGESSRLGGCRVYLEK
jgi:SAM-dependent methyltransferase